MATPRKLASGSWTVEFCFEGQRHRITRPLRKQVMAEYRQALADLQAGSFIPPDRKREKVADRIDAWLTMRADDPNLRESSWVQYERTSRLHITPHLGNYTMQSLTVEAVEGWRNRLVATTTESTARQAIDVLRNFLADQERHGYVTRNVARLVKPPKYDPARGIMLAPAELHRLVDELQGAPCTVEAEPSARRRHGHMLIDEGHPQWELMSSWAADVALGLAYIGCRIGDLSDLTSASWDKINGRLHVVDRKTGNDRDIPVFAALREVLERCESRGGEFLFGSDGLHGKHQLVPRSFRNHRFNPASVRAGLPEVTPHDLRHSCASWLIGMGFGPVQVAAYMGHSNPSTTMRIYAHLFADDMASMGEALDQMAAMRPDDNVTRLRTAK